MIYELRVYDAAPGKLGQLSARFRDHTLKLFEKHGVKSIGYWTDERDKDGNRLTYMVAFDDLADMERKWAAFRVDPEWLRVRAESEQGGSLVTKVASTILRPTDYSPLQ